MLKVNDSGAYKDIHELYKKNSSSGYDYIGEIYKKSPNLFDKDNVNWIKDSANYSYIGSTNGIITKFLATNYEVDRTFYIPIKSNTTYTVVFGNTTYTKRIGTYVTAVESSTTANYQNNITADSATITSGASDNYLVVQLYTDANYASGARSADIIPSVMIVEGSIVPSSYIPYKYEHIFSAGYDTTVIGNPATMSNARAKSLAYTLNGNSKRTIEIDGTTYDVPDGYTLLDYIQSSGTQYINTGITPSDTTNLEIDIVPLAFASNQVMVGSRVAAGNSSYNIFKLSSNTSFRFDLSDKQSGTTSKVGSTKYNLKITDKKGYVDNVLVVNLSEAAAFTSTLPIYLFAINHNGTVNNQATCQIYGCKIWQDGSTLSFNGVPAKRISDSVLGMYDLVSGTFFTNAGTGTFTAGNELPTPDANLGVIGCGDISKNLFDIITAKDGYFVRAGNATTENPLGSEGASSTWSCSDYIPVSPSTTYTVTYPYYQSATAAGLVCFTNKTVASAISGVTTGTQGSAVYTFTTPATCNYIRFSWNHTQGNNCQLEAGSSSTTIVPHYQFPLTLVSNCEIKILKGTETFTLSNGMFCLNLADGNTSSDTGNICVSNQFEFNSVQTGIYLALTDGQFAYQRANKNLFFKHAATTTVDAWKTYLAAQYAAGNPVIVYYSRSTDTSFITPTTCTIYDDSQLMRIYTGGKVDLGTLTWYYTAPTSSYPYGFFAASNLSDKAAGLTNLYCYGYETGISSSDKHVWGNANSGSIVVVVNSAYNTVAEFKAAMSGVYLYYQRTTDTSWTQPYFDTISSTGTRTNKIIKIDLGSLYWGTTPYGGYSTYTTPNALSPLMVSDSSGSGTSPMLCDCYKASNWSAIRYYTADNYTIAIHPDGNGIWIRNEDYDDDTLYPTGQDKINAFTAAMSGKYLYAVLRTATTESITVPSISTVAGTNYLECATELLPSELDATYRKKTK